MATNFGTDIVCRDDLDPHFTLVSGKPNLMNAIIRRLSTPRGSLFTDADYGYDLVSLLSKGLTPAGLAQAEAAITAEVEKDERVLSCAATFAFDPTVGTLQVTLGITTADGPFTLVLNVSSLGVASL